MKRICERCQRVVVEDDFHGPHEWWNGERHVNGEACLRCAGEYSPFVDDRGSVFGSMGSVFSRPIGQILDVPGMNWEETDNDTD